MNEPTHDPDYQPTAADWLEAAEQVLREIHANSSGQIEDPHFRHWAATTILSYFAAKGEMIP